MNLPIHFTCFRHFRPNRLLTDGTIQRLKHVEQRFVLSVCCRQHPANVRLFVQGSMEDFKKYCFKSGKYQHISHAFPDEICQL